MANWTHFVLVRIEYLGFRYHGWQKQPDTKTIQGMVDKTLAYVLGHKRFRTLGCGRTDSKVSADDFCFELFMENEDRDLDDLLFQLNENFPTDIRGKSIKYTNAKFNIIQNSKEKEYHYTFSFGEKSHPFNAPIIMGMNEDLDIEAMIKAAHLFEGEWNYKQYTAKSKPKDSYHRVITKSVIERSTKFSGDFMPKNTYVFKVRSKGFMRYQVRLMMGALLNIGKGEWTLEDFKETLSNNEGEQVANIAPSSGLCLHSVEFED